MGSLFFFCFHDSNIAVVSILVPSPTLCCSFFLAALEREPGPACDVSDNFVMRQFTDDTYTGTKVAYDPQEFEDKVGLSL